MGSGHHGRERTGVSLTVGKDERKWGGVERKRETKERKKSVTRDSLEAATEDFKSTKFRRKKKKKKREKEKSEAKKLSKWQLN